ncbi:MAG: hypothetical protein ACTSPI_06765 [Candidatus Heimdallarchaeaceae archaeon]
MLAIIKKDFTIMMKLLENVDPNNKPITEETIPTLEEVEDIFLESIKKNISVMIKFKALFKVLDSKELMFDEETLDYIVDTTIEESEPNKNLYT